MALRAHLTGYRKLTWLKNAALRTGLYSGVLLSAAMLIWLALANRAAWLEPFAWERNVAGAAAVGILALVPLVRFLKFPPQLFLSGITGWGIFCLAYRLYCFYFSRLDERMGAFHLFTLGAMLYLFAATSAWIGTVLWNIRLEHAAHTHTRHHTS